jgi:hypothetical protein
LYGLAPVLKNKKIFKKQGIAGLNDGCSLVEPPKRRGGLLKRSPDFSDKRPSMRGTRRNVSDVPVLRVFLFVNLSGNAGFGTFYIKNRHER